VDLHCVELLADDFSTWLDDDIKNPAAGFQARGSKESVLVEVMRLLLNPSFGDQLRAAVRHPGRKIVAV
jgi:hypothetical protein